LTFVNSAASATQEPATALGSASDEPANRQMAALVDAFDKASLHETSVIRKQSPRAANHLKPI